MKKKVFLYMYPIEQFISQYKFREKMYDHIIKDPRPLPILNYMIDERYRKRDYIVMYVLFPDTKRYGLDRVNGDKRIYADIPFSKVDWDDEWRRKRKDFVPEIPDNEYILKQVEKYVKLKNISELVVSGFFSRYYVKQMAKLASEKGVNTVIDLDLTEIFFLFYNKSGFLTKEPYNPDKFYEFYINFFKDAYPDCEKDLYEIFGDPIYDMFVVDRSLKR